MVEIVLTDLARQYLAERRAEARRIVAGGDAYTDSQRAWAWATLTGQRPHFRSPGAQHMPPAPLVPPSPPWGGAA